PTPSISPLSLHDALPISQRLANTDKERALTNILFALDVSGSMTSPFGDGKRSDKAIEAINEFTTYRKGDAFGLTIFGSDVLHWRSEEHTSELQSRSDLVC